MTQPDILMLLDDAEDEDHKSRITFASKQEN